MQRQRRAIRSAKGAGDDSGAVDPRITLMVREDNIKKIQSQTAADPTLIALATVIKQDWPTHRRATDVTVRPYFSFRDELTTHDGLIYKGQRLVVPLALRKEMLHVAKNPAEQTEEKATQSPNDRLLFT